jgi:hypothetical protein
MGEDYILLQNLEYTWPLIERAKRNNRLNNHQNLGLINKKIII